MRQHFVARVRNGLDGFGARSAITALTMTLATARCCRKTSSRRWMPRFTP